MLKGNKRLGFNVPTTLNSPVVVHSAGAAEHVTKDEVLQFLDGFITEKESLVVVGGNNEDVDVNLSTALSQLRRIQRDFKGLPPTVLEEAAVSKSDEEQAKSE